ncbi:hypothetical protein GCM10009798_23430 [Nocardioides panacihumi]|uniref:Uncharacterized protein n=1 Tax=Nocardioides panacihumi TaxID=400774 RepID=A0ABN2R415_9ACTN
MLGAPSPRDGPRGVKLGAKGPVLWAIGAEFIPTSQAGMAHPGQTGRDPGGPGPACRGGGTDPSGEGVLT